MTKWDRVWTAIGGAVSAEIFLSPLWHEPLAEAIRGVHVFWGRSEVLCAPIWLWHELLMQLGLPLGQYHSFLGGLAAIFVGVPVVVVGGLALEAVWFGPYLVIRVVLAVAHGAMTMHLLVPGVVAAIAWRRSPRLRNWIRPRAPRVIAITRDVRATLPARRRRQGTARSCLMGPEHAALYGRVDPLTRTRFRLGERFVLCGACARPYKVASCEQLQYRCPVDGVSLHVDRQDNRGSASFQ